ncbi:unnamed protein product [Arctogadus glacialis]
MMTTKGPISRVLEARREALRLYPAPGASGPRGAPSQQKAPSRGHLTPVAMGCQARLPADRRADTLDRARGDPHRSAAQAGVREGERTSKATAVLVAAV